MVHCRVRSCAGRRERSDVPCSGVRRVHVAQFYHGRTADGDTLRHEHTGYLFPICDTHEPTSGDLGRGNAPNISSTITGWTCLSSPPASCAIASKSVQYHSFASALLSGVNVPFPSGILSIPSMTTSSPSPWFNGGFQCSTPCRIACARVEVMNPLFTRTVVGCAVGSSLVRWKGWIRFAPGAPSYTRGPRSIGGSRNLPLRRTRRN